MLKRHQPAICDAKILGYLINKNGRKFRVTILQVIRNIYKSTHKKNTSDEIHSFSKSKNSDKKIRQILP